MNEEYRARGALKSGDNECFNEGVIVPTALYGAEACGMRSAERGK